MIDRYSRPAMSKVWSEDHVFQLWLKVEVAAAQAWTELGVIPAADMARIRKKARFNRRRYDENFAQTRHDIISFTRGSPEPRRREPMDPPWAHLQRRQGHRPEPPDG